MKKKLFWLAIIAVLLVAAVLGYQEYTAMLEKSASIEAVLMKKGLHPKAQIEEGWLYRTRYVLPDVMFRFYEIFNQIFQLAFLVAVGIIFVISTNYKLAYTLSSKCRKIGFLAAKILCLVIMILLVDAFLLHLLNEIRIRNRDLEFRIVNAASLYAFSWSSLVLIYTSVIAKTVEQNFLNALKEIFLFHLLLISSLIVISNIYCKPDIYTKPALPPLFNVISSECEGRYK